MAILFAFALVACSGGDDSKASGTTNVGTGGNGGGSGLTGRELFEQTVQPGLEENCGICHISAGIADFLAPPDVYANITAYKSVNSDKPLLWPVPEDSVLYWFPDSSDHTSQMGRGYDPDLTDLKQAVLTWLKDEAQRLPPLDDTKPSIVPAKPILGGLNAIYLDPLGPEFVGSSITFIPVEHGAPPSLLQLTNISVYPAAIGLRLVHPRFVVFPPESTTGEPDPVDTLSDLDQTILPQMDPTLGTGEVVLTNWVQDARMSIDFDLGKLEKLDLGAGGEILVPCTNVNLYQTAVESLGQGGPLYCAENCHGGARPQAKAAMNLSGLIANPRDYDAACAAMRARITPGEVDSSQIVIVTDPTQVQVVHMYKFEGNKNKHQAFKTGMSPWILAE